MTIFKSKRELIMNSWTQVVQNFYLFIFFFFHLKLYFKYSS